MSEHLKLPLTIAPGGGFSVAAEDSIQEITQNVRVVLTTRPGERLATAALGIADPTFTVLNAESAFDVVAAWEPRADLQLVAEELSRQGIQTAIVAVSRRQDG